MKAFVISGKSLGNNWIDGTIDGFRFQAKVYNAGSVYGINKGRVSKLRVWNQAISGPSGWIVNYDRAWDIKPASGEEQERLHALLRYLEEWGVMA